MESVMTDVLTWHSSATSGVQPWNTYTQAQAQAQAQAQTRHGVSTSQGCVWRERSPLTCLGSGGEYSTSPQYTDEMKTAAMNTYTPCDESHTGWSHNAPG